MSDETILTLPAEFRPAQSITGPLQDGSGIYRIYTDGRVRVIKPSPPRDEL